MKTFMKRSSLILSLFIGLSSVAAHAHDQQWHQIMSCDNGQFILDIDQNNPNAFQVVINNSHAIAYLMTNQADSKYLPDYAHLYDNNQKMVLSGVAQTSHVHGHETFSYAGTNIPQGTIQLSGTDLKINLFWAGFEPTRFPNWIFHNCN